MSIVNATPTVWAGEILRALETILVYANPRIMNHKYEGEIRESGDSVKILTVGDVTVKPYTKNAAIDAPERLTDADLRLVITEADYFNVAIDDIDAAQIDSDLMVEVARRAAYSMRAEIDGFAASLYTDIPAGVGLGTDASPITGFNASASKAYDQLVTMKTQLDTTDTPEDGRFAVIPPWYEGYIQKDPRFTSYGTPGNRTQLENGMMAGDNGLIGRAAGFDLYRSNNVPNVAGAKHKIIGGHNSAWSFASQILQTEAYRLEAGFSDGLKGLSVYGGKVIRPNNLAVQVASDA